MSSERNSVSSKGKGIDVGSRMHCYCIVWGTAADPAAQLHNREAMLHVQAMASSIVRCIPSNLHTQISSNTSPNYKRR